MVSGEQNKLQGGVAMLNASVCANFGLKSRTDMKTGSILNFQNTNLPAHIHLCDEYESIFVGILIGSDGFELNQFPCEIRFFKLLKNKGLILV